jgi:putative ABC transport system permease protein
MLTDLRHGARMLRRSPGLAILAAVALALGIGSTTTMFSITNGILRQLPVEAAERLMHVASIDQARGEWARMRVPDLVALREQQRSFSAIGAYEDVGAHLGDARHRAVRVPAALMTASMFDVLRVRPFLGRTLAATDEQPGAPPVAVLGYVTWRDRYAADRGIIGQTMRVNGVPTTIVGVMPNGFQFPTKEELWTPLRLDPTAAPVADAPAYIAVGRLRDGVTRDAANAEAAGIARRLDLATPVPNAPRVFGVRPYRDEMVPAKARLIFRAMLLAVSFVLLIACANVANLLLARAVQRSREIAVRTALGASRGRIIAQLLGESLAVSVVGGLLGLLLAWGATTVFSATLSFDLAYWMAVRIDRSVLLFATGLVGLATVLAGLAPARQATHVNVSDALKNDTRGSSSFRLGRASRALVVGEVALSFALLVVTALMVKGVVHIVDRNGGIGPDRVLVSRLELRDDAYPDAAAQARFYETLARRLDERPDVEAATVFTDTPGTEAARTRMELDGVRYEPDGPRPAARIAAVTPGYLETFGTRLLQGRGFAWTDGPNAPPVAIVNRPFIATYFAGGDAIGRRVRLLTSEGKGDWVTIIGVAPDLDMGGAAEAHAPGLYVPIAQRSRASVTVALRSARDPLRILPALRTTVAAIDADVPLWGENRLDLEISHSTTGEKVFGGLFTFFGVAALVLALVGLFGVLAFSVSRRTKELGIRIALGGRTRDITWLVLRAGVLQLAIGLAIGTLLALAIAPAFGDALFGQNPRDWTVYASVAAVLFATGLSAAAVPARRALRVDPMEALRSE